MPIRAAQFQLLERVVRALLLVLVIAAPCATSVAARAEVEHKRVLVLFSHDPHAASQVIVERAMRSTLEQGSPVPVEIYSEYLDAARTGMGVYEKELVSLLRRKYEGKKFDLIFTISDLALKLLLRNGPELFPGTPIVFLTLDRHAIAGLNLGPNVTGVWGEINFKSNLELALPLHPGTNQVVVISGVSEWDKYWTARVQEDLREYESSVEFTYLIGLTSEELQKELAGLPPHTIAVFVTSVLDRAGNTYDNMNLLSEISPGAAAPIYGSTDAQLGFGIVGGRLLSFEALGVGAGHVGLRVLAGEKVETIAPHGIPSVAIFDWRELKQWGISESSLPTGSVVRYHVLSFWDQYKWHITSLFLLIIFQAAFITGLVINRVRRNRAEESLRHSEERNRAMLCAIPDLMFLQSSDGVYLDYHAKDPHDLLVQPSDFLGKRPHDVLPPKLAEDFLGCFRRAKETGEPQLLEYIVPIQDKERWFEARVVFTQDEQFLSVVRDVTAKKVAQDALRESEERFRNMADTAPVMIWVSDPDRLCTYFNQQWLDFTGRTLEEEIGNGWTEGLHPQDFERCLATYNSAFGLREPFTMEYRLRCADGQFRWVLDSGTPRLSSGGEFLGYIGSRIDITERKAAEESLRNLSGQLIRAREDECARIARDLHDELSQRMAIISIELELFGQSLPGPNGQTRTQLQGILRQAAEVSREIHQISHDLHPSKLKQLGLVAAVRGLCNELQRSHELDIEFIAEGVPANLSEELSLCLYRIVQEGLNNVIKHSGAKEAKVEMVREGEELWLRVMDRGKGFEIESPGVKDGLGLIGMRERLRLVGGQVSISSRPSGGTQVEARVRWAGNGYEAGPANEKRQAAQD